MRILLVLLAALGLVACGKAPSVDMPLVSTAIEKLVPSEKEQILVDQLIKYQRLHERAAAELQVYCEGIKKQPGISPQSGLPGCVAGPSNPVQQKGPQP